VTLQSALIAFIDSTFNCKFYTIILYVLKYLNKRFGAFSISEISKKQHLQFCGFVIWIRSFGVACGFVFRRRRYGCLHELLGPQFRIDTEENTH